MKATTKTESRKFPLHQSNGRWSKKIDGKRVYFGKVDEVEQWQALDAYRDYVARIEAFGADHPKPTTVKQLIALYLESSEALVESGERKPWTLVGIKQNMARFEAKYGDDRLDTFGPRKFQQIAQQWSNLNPNSQNTYRRYVRQLFNFAHKEGWIDEPVKFGQNFGFFGEEVLAPLRDERDKFFTREECLTILNGVNPKYRAMILLGINCALNVQDLACLEESAIKLDDEELGPYLNYRRQKNAKARILPLWPETLAAIKIAIKLRPTAKDTRHKRRVFLTRTGRSYEGRAGLPTYFSRLIRDELGIEKMGASIGAFRHVFATVASNCVDAEAVDRIMGHRETRMVRFYQQTAGFDGQRLVKVSNFVRAWLFDGEQLDEQPADDREAIVAGPWRTVG